MTSELLSGLVAGLIGAALGMVAVGFMVYRRERELNVERFQFRFLRLRDELRFLAATGDLDPRVPTYTLMISLVNLAIRNAGSMRLRDLPLFADAVDERMRKVGDVAWKDFKSQPAEVHRLVARIFMELGKLMVSNDPLLGWVLTQRTLGRRSRLSAIVAHLDRLSFAVLPRNEVAERAKGMMRIAQEIGPEVDDETLDLWAPTSAAENNNHMVAGGT